MFLYPAELQTLSVPLSVQYFDPSGFFAGLGIVYVNQDIQAIDPESSMPGSFVLMPTQNEEFTLVDVGLGYRLPKRRGIVALQANNVFDKEFRYQDYSFQTGTSTIDPVYIPERTIYGSADS
ncbi:MAG: TonB-dependent receptor [Candidatus Competibacter sp.]